MNLPRVEALVRSLPPPVVLWALKADLLDHGLANALAVLPPTSRFVFASSDAGFGRGSTAKILRGEATVQASRRPTTIVRVGPLYGPDVHGPWDGRTTIMVQAFAAGRTVARAPNLVKSFGRVEDAGTVLARLMVAPAPGILHVATPPKSQDDVARAVATAPAARWSRYAPCQSPPIPRCRATPRSPPGTPSAWRAGGAHWTLLAAHGAALAPVASGRRL